MADVPGAPDPKGFQAGEGGKVIVEAGLNIVGKAANAIKEGINKRNQDAAEHNKNVSMQQWRMAAQQQLNLQRDKQQQDSNERINAKQVKGKVLGKVAKTAVKELGKQELSTTQGKVDRTNQRSATRETQKLRDSGARETSVTKDGTQASFGPKRATAAKKPQPAQSAQSRNAKNIRRAMRGGNPR
jgi:hypothetical protein